MSLIRSRNGLVADGRAYPWERHSFRRRRLSQPHLSHVPFHLEAGEPFHIAREINLCSHASPSKCICCPGVTVRLVLFQWRKLEGVHRKVISGMVIRPVASLAADAMLVERAIAQRVAPPSGPESDPILRPCSEMQFPPRPTKLGARSRPAQEKTLAHWLGQGPSPEW
jgi:hypothetical protein